MVKASDADVVSVDTEHKNRKKTVSNHEISSTHSELPVGDGVCGGGASSGKRVLRAGALRLYDHGDVLPVSDWQNLPWKGDGYVGFGAMVVVGEGSKGERNRILRGVEEGELLVLREAFG